MCWVRGSKNERDGRTSSMTSTIFRLQSKLLYFTTIEKNLSSFLINRLAVSYPSDLSFPQTCHVCSHVWASEAGWFCCLECILSPALYGTRHLHDIHTSTWKSPSQQVLPDLHTPVRMPSAASNKEDPTRKSQNEALVIHATRTIVEGEFWHWIFSSIRTLAKTQVLSSFSPCRPQQVSNPPLRVTRGLWVLQPSQEGTVVSREEDRHFPPCTFY